MNSKDLDDVDDDLFISKKPQSYIFEEKKDATSQSLINSRKLLLESEQAGRNALEDLSVQREALERTENNLDSINAMNRITQKHLKNMRSFFGGIKNLFSETKDASQLQKEIKDAGLPRSATVASFPAPNSSTGGVSSSNSDRPNTFASASRNAVQALDKELASASSATNGIRSKTIEEDKPVDDLDEIGYGLGRLKELAMKLGNEIEDHNDMLDRITDKTERAGDSIKHQNRHMQQLLKK